MELKDAISLVEFPGIRSGGSAIWADLGAGSGLFSQALLSVLPAHSTVHAVDAREYKINVEGIVFHQSDFVKEPFPFAKVDGILMANSLHFVRDKHLFLGKLNDHLREDGRVLLVEYNMDTPNRWVPYPLSFETAKSIFREAGFSRIDPIREVPSRYHSSNIYSALIER